MMHKDTTKTKSRKRSRPNNGEYYDNDTRTGAAVLLDVAKRHATEDKPEGLPEGSVQGTLVQPDPASIHSIILNSDQPSATGPEL
mmetsp:Transcript_16684/g.25965  ORF Transcript_16684/g.25965 Transcript_16684/m.25965 type:complete len:85 (+) Transcript_16684:3-257(+)